MESRNEIVQLRTANETSQIALLKQQIQEIELLLTEHPDAALGSIHDLGFASPAVTVVTPTWNRSKAIADAIRSVQDQRFADWELIIVDDGSADETPSVVAAIAASDSRIRYVRQAHAGQCAARNSALRLAKGVLIAYLDSDNVWYRNFLATAVAAFAADPTIDCAYGAMITEVHRPDRRILFETFDRERLLAGNYIGMSTFVHRRTLVDRYGGFDEALTSLEDWDLVLRYTEHTAAKRLPVLAVRYRVINSGRVSASQSDEPNYAKIRAKWQKR